MKSCPGALATWLAGLSGDASCWRADLVTITLLSGTIYRWTTNDTNITYGGNTYLASGGGSAPIVKRGNYRQSSRLTVDTLDLMLCGSFTINGFKLPALASWGFFDGARVKIDHMIGAYPGDTSLGAIGSFFEGPVASVEPRSLEVALRLKSQLELFNLQLPRFTVSPQCGNAVYDANCGVNRSSYLHSGTALTGSTVSTIVLTDSAIKAHPDDYFNLGVVQFTSGALSGWRRAVSDWDTSAGILTLAVPLPQAPANGDGFTVFPGCDRSRSQCSTKFSNLAHYRGFPWVPRPEAGSK